MSSSQGRKQCKDPKTVRVYVIDNASSCEKLLQSFQSRYTFERSYIGLDCEWVDKKGQFAPVALLQIATPLFDCFLFRLCKMDGQMPKAVKQILEDRTILKFGVGIQNDARRLSEMFGIQVRGCVDLRHIITQRTQVESGDKLSCQKVSLAALAKKILGVTLDKSWRIRCSNWEDDKLSNQQIEYAMNDALVASHIFLRLMKEKQSTDLDDPSPGVCHAYEDEDTSQSSSMTSKCQPDNNGTDITLKQSGENLDFCLTGQVAAACYYGHHDICPSSQMCEKPFQDLASGAEYYEITVDLNKFESCDMEGYLLREEVIQLMSPPSSTQTAVSLCQGVIDVPFQGGKKKVHLNGKDSNPKSPENSHKAYKNVPMRESPLCTNCILTAPDGSELTSTSRKRADWYIGKKLGHQTSLDPYTVQLNFEPAGRPGIDDYCLDFIHNKCVVCGWDETYDMTKKIVPYDYRCHFPPAMKDHNSHDVLPTCPECNSLAYFHDNKLRKKLASEYNAPLESASMPRLVEDPELRKVKSAAKALSHAGNKIPEDRRQELSLIVQKHFSASALTPEMISQAATIETHKENANFVSHGFVVVKKVCAEGKLLEFEKRWREHFVNTMQPKFLPPLWSVDHRHEILKGKLRDCPDHL